MLLVRHPQAVAQRLSLALKRAVAAVGAAVADQLRPSLAVCLRMREAVACT